MKIATERFVTVYGGDRIVIDEGDRVDDDHELVAAHPEHWRTFTLKEELSVRSARVAELQRDQAAQHLAREPVSPATTREREEEAFWRSVDRLLAPHQPASERGLQAICDQGIATADRLAHARSQAEMDEWHEAWQGRVFDDAG